MDSSVNLTSLSPQPYSKPLAMGGTLVRAVIQQLTTVLDINSRTVMAPNTQLIQEPILIACSGGIDSMALVHLISKYGRKIIDPSLITVLHFDHGWRPESATIEREGVAELAKKLGVKFLARDLTRPLPHVNLEADARKKRNEVYLSLAGKNDLVLQNHVKKYRYVMTAHHQDDVVETLIWRFMRGEFLEQPQGILPFNDPVLRPFIQVSKQQLREYVQQEKITVFEDPTNQDLEQMRARLRHEVLPLLEEMFPGFRKKVASYHERLVPTAAANNYTKKV